MSALVQSWSRSASWSGLLGSRTPGPSLVPRLFVAQTAHASGSATAQTGAKTGAKTALRTVKDLPHVGFFKLFYRLLVKGFYNRMHELQLYEKDLYGSIYRDGLRTVAVSSAELLEEVLRKDEKFPVRGDMSLWKEARDSQAVGFGPFTEEGQRWYRLRSVLNKKMLLPKESLQFGPVIRDVVRDFTDRVQVLRKSSPSGDLVEDIANELYRFSLEGIASVLFETRIGCLEERIPEGTQEFIDSIVQMFSNSPYVIVLPKWSRPLLPFWRRYHAGWEGIFAFAKVLIDRKMAEIERRADQQEALEGEYLTYLLSNTDMSLKDVYGSVAELLLAGVDTTSNTLTWALHLLSLHPEVQSKLYREVSQSRPEPSAEELTRMPYLKATIKETLRMFPVVPLNARIFSEKDVVVGGYSFPKKTPFTFHHYAISHDPRTFPAPFEFRPERWVRDGRTLPHPFGSIPFGFGVRGCVGRRIAELEMNMALFQLVRLFEIRPEPSVGEVKSLNRTVLVPDRKLQLHFRQRD
ncbi:sterol 26-hydroxylase, mitochondrial isoform X3 [Eucyclogobius newberryi]|uniref:sterol 26-hydroxylase, mitochondrial isoform X3 n=1 Tax=Eucyclogobius newberryi TaxID=166745 RepID=UPI003B5A4E47